MTRELITDFNQLSGREGQLVDLALVAQRRSSEDKILVVLNGPILLDVTVRVLAFGATFAGEPRVLINKNGNDIDLKMDGGDPEVIESNPDMVIVSKRNSDGQCVPLAISRHDIRELAEQTPAQWRLG